MVTKLKTLLPLERAETIVQGAFDAAAQQVLLPLTVVVLDVGGHVIVLKRQDGCGIVRAEVAIAKAWGALGMGMPSGFMGKAFAENQNFASGLVGASKGRMAPNPGGILVLDDTGEAIGAVGISGDTGPNDEIRALAGVVLAGFASASSETG